MGLFNGIAGAGLSFGANYARAGKYIMFIRGVKEGKTRNGKDFVAIEKKCLEVIEGIGDDPHYPGEEMTDMLMADNDSFLSNFKTFVLKAMELTPEQKDEITEEVSDLITSEEQPLRGFVMEVENIERIAQKSGKQYTLKKYMRRLPKEELVARFKEEDLIKILTVDELEILGGAEA